MAAGKREQAVDSRGGKYPPPDFTDGGPESGVKWRKSCECGSLEKAENCEDRVSSRGLLLLFSVRSLFALLSVFPF